jgi:RHS repeat-associated protein
VIQKRAYGTYGGEADQGEVRGTSTPPNDPDQMKLQPNATTIHPFGYTGRRWDADLGLYYYRARWYDPTLGTFLETDPIGSLDYVNLYAYVGLEPGNGVDPTGLRCQGTNGGTGKDKPQCTLDYFKGGDRVVRLTAENRAAFSASKNENTQAQWRNVLRTERQQTQAFTKLLRNEASNPSGQINVSNGESGATSKTRTTSNAELVATARQTLVYGDGGRPVTTGSFDGYRITVGLGTGTLTSGVSNEIQTTAVHEWLHATPGLRDLNYGQSNDDNHQEQFDNKARGLLGL